MDLLKAMKEAFKSIHEPQHLAWIAEKVIGDGFWKSSGKTSIALMDMEQLVMLLM